MEGNGRLNSRYSWFIKVLLISTLFVLGSCDSKSKDAIRSNFFGIHINNSKSPSTGAALNDNLGNGSIRLWDARVSWRHLEPQKGKFNFEILDGLVARATKNNQEIVLTMGQPPDWATGGKALTPFGTGYNSLPPENIEDWRSYVRTVGERYKGQIKYYEIWNEPNLKDFYSGSIIELVNLTREANQILKRIDPENKVISPSVTGDATYLNDYLRLGGSRVVDIIGVHLYVSPELPEKSISMIKKYKEVMLKNKVGELPLWNTEWTWLNFRLDGKLNDTQLMPETMASAYLARQFFIDVGMGIDRSFFYGFNYGASKIRLVDGTNPKWILMPSVAYKNVTSWLTGAEVLDFSYNNRKDIYKLSILSSEGKKAIIIWTKNSLKEFKIPSDFDEEGKYYSVIGEVKEYHKRKVQLTDIPIIVYEQ